jgi:hypothetical protein
MIVNLMAFGYEMTNLTLNHDDVNQILIQNSALGHQVGRFTLGWLHYYTQNAYFMPFLQMAEGMLLMTAYGLLIAHFWGCTKTADIVLLASIVSAFPFMGQIYSYNTAQATYPLAHLLAAVAAVLSVRSTFTSFTIASLLYTTAFSIYQSVIGNAIAIVLVWALSVLLFNREHGPTILKKLARSTAIALLPVIAGGMAYLFLVKAMGSEISSYQNADQAFHLNRGIDIVSAVNQIANGTRSFFFRSESYFPRYLKTLQLCFVLGAGLFCLWRPRGPVLKGAAVMLCILVILAPRLLQLIHPAGDYHNLTLTGYAITIAGFVMIVVRLGQTPIRNLALILASGLVAGYVMQCNWISTVNQLNTYAHYSTMSQILSRIKSLPAERWNGKMVVVAGAYKMPATYPFSPATGVAKQFIDSGHVQALAHLMREGILFIPINDSMPAVLEYAGHLPPWPDPASVGAVDGVAVVVLSGNNP